MNIDREVGSIEKNKIEIQEELEDWVKFGF